MRLTAYLYSGPPSSASLRHEGETLDVRLIPGKTVELPAEHEYTKVLLHLKTLTPTEAAEAEVTTSSPTTEGASPQEAVSLLSEPGTATETKPAKVAKKPTTTASATTDGGAAQ